MIFVSNYKKCMQVLVMFLQCEMMVHICLVHNFVPSKALKIPDISYPIFMLSPPCTCCNPQLIRYICSVAAGSSFWTVSNAALVFVHVFSVVFMCAFEGFPFVNSFCHSIVAILTYASIVFPFCGMNR